VTRTERAGPVSLWWLAPEAVVLLERVSRGLESPERLRLLAALQGGERSVTTLVRLTGRSQSRVSKHLALLRRLGLVERRAQGSLRFYQLPLHDPAAQAVRALLTELTRGGGAPGMADTGWQAATKPCAHCGAPFGPNVQAGPSRWATRRYCSPACAGAARHRWAGRARHCAQCGVRFPAMAPQQRFCTGSCYDRWRVEHRSRQRRRL
jgi:DNA-binding transcriptional ArsR family regulator